MFVREKRVRVNQYRAQIRQVEEILKKHDADLLILGKDSAYYPTACWVRAAKNLDVKSVLIPFDEASTEALGKHRFDHDDHVVVSEIDEQVAERYPKWVHEYGGQQLLLLPAAQVTALNMLGLVPPNPWAYNSSNCDYIFLSSSFHKEKFISEGASEGQLRVTGAVYQDFLAASHNDVDKRRKELLESLGLVDDRLLVLGSMTPDKFDERDVPLEFTGYHEMIEYWVKALTRDGRFNVILCLHPNVNYDDVVYLEKYGAHIVLRETAELIALCDIYVVDCSATSKWALAAGKLVIDYDLLRYDLDFHSNSDGIIHLRTKAEFEKALEALYNGELNQEIEMVRTRAEKGFWGVMDGLASKRIHEECLRILENE